MHISLIGWLDRMLSTKTIAEAIAAGTEASGMFVPAGQEPPLPEVISDIWHGKNIRKLRSQYLDFFTNPNNIVIGLTADGFLAFPSSGQKEKSNNDDDKGKSVWPFTVTLFNLPPYVRTKLGASIPIGFTPMNHMHDIQQFLVPMVDELRYLFEVGAKG